MLNRLFVLFLIAFLTACSGVSRTPEDKAITYALVEDGTLRQLAEECSKVSTAAKQASWKGLRSWWKRNGSLVEAADFGLTYHVLQFSNDRQETGARYAMGLTYDIVAMSERKVEELLAGSGKEGKCLDLMEEYKDGAKDLSDESDYYPLLVNLQSQNDRRGKDTLMEIAEISAKKGKAHSRNAYTVERLMKREGCPKAKISTLKANWPIEIFGATCPDKTFLLVRCEWSKCKVQQ